MEKNFNLEIISPEKIILSEKVNSVTIHSFEGEMTILLDHIPLITFLRPGIEDSKALLAKENLSDKAKYIVSHKIDTLSKINQ